MAKSILVKVTKNGEVLEVNPGTLEAHKRSGWTEVKEEVKAVPLVPTQTADALKLSAAGGSEEKKEGGDPALQDAANQPSSPGKKK